MLKPWHYLVAALALAGAGYAFGRFAAPDKVVTVEKEVIRTVEKEVGLTHEQVFELAKILETMRRETHTETTTTVKPDGTTETKIVEDTKTEKTTETETEKVAEKDESKTTETETTREVETTKIVERARPGWKVSVMAGLDFPYAIKGELRPVYGGSIERRLFGPLSAGVWGLTSGAGGLSLSLEF